MRAYGASIGVIGVILLNVVFLNLRLFARDHGLKVHWWSGSYAPICGNVLLGSFEVNISSNLSLDGLAVMSCFVRSVEAA